MPWSVVVLLLAVFLQLGEGAQSFLPSLPSLVPSATNTLCAMHSQAYIMQLDNASLWATTMYDATSKDAVGLISGNSYQLGEFDECLSVRADLGDKLGILDAQYCLLEIRLPVNRTVQHYSLDYDPHMSVWTRIQLNADKTQWRRDILYRAVCVPASCSAFELQKTLSRQPYGVSKMSTRVDPRLCQTQHTLQANKTFTRMDIVIAATIVFLMCAVLASTVYDLFIAWLQDTSSGWEPATGSWPGENVFLCFSIRRNISFLSSMNLSNTGFDCIHGLRLLFMILAISGHRFLVNYAGPILNHTVTEQGYRSPLNMYIMNGMLVVDTFFVYSGLLTAYYLPLQLDKNENLNPLLIWIYRFIRLSPAYLLVVAFHATLLGKFGDGPIWPNIVGLERDRCAQNWWTNILYLNNYINTETMCMFQSWYLAVDTHLFMIAVVLVYTMWRWPKIGYSLLAISALLATLVPFTITYANSSNAYMLLYPEVIKDIVASEHFNSFYAKTHMRAGPYVVGVVTGYLLYKLKDKDFKLPTILLYMGHIFAILLCLAVQFSGYVFYIPGAPYLPFASALYSATHRSLWGAGIALNIFLLVRGHIGWLHKALTWRPLVPVSRLTYCAYLIHTVTQLYEISVLRTPRTITYYSGIWLFVGDILFTFLISLGLCLLVEAPFRAMEKVAFGNRKEIGKSKRESEEHKEQLSLKNISQIETLAT